VDNGGWIADSPIGLSDGRSYEPLSRKKGHLRIVGDCAQAAVRRSVITNTRGPEPIEDLGPREKLNGGAKRVPDCAPQQAATKPILMGRKVCHSAYYPIDTIRNLADTNGRYSKSVRANGTLNPSLCMCRNVPELLTPAYSSAVRRNTTLARLVITNADKCRATEFVVATRTRK
jgi:hypothetical protein